MKTLFIIDSNSLIYKAYYAIKNLTDANGASTNAIYGFLKMLLKIISSYSPDTIIAVFDVGKKTFRTELFPDYKATRPPTPPDLIPQFGVIKKIITAMKIPVVQQENYEADDIIGSLAKKFSDEYSVKILTGDKDMNQLISENITILNSKKGVSDILEIDKKMFEELYDIRQEQFVDYLALIGDTSDNIPGVKGIGPKTAVKLLKEFERLENIFDNVNSITPDSVRDKLIAGRENAFLSRTLATIKIDLELDENYPDFSVDNLKNIKEILTELQFKSLLKELSLDIYPETITPKSESFINFELKKIETQEDENLFFSELEKLQEIFVYQAILNDEKILYACILNNILLIPMENEGLLKKMFETINKNKILLICYDIKKIFRYLMSLECGISDLILFDYKIIAGLLYKDETAHKVLSHYNNIEIDSIENLEFEQLNLFEKKLTDETEKKIYVFFNYYIALKKKFYEKLDETLQNDVYLKIEAPLIKLTSAMEFKGIKVDVEYLKRVDKEIEKRIVNIENEIFELIEEKININSPKQVAELLFDRLKLPSQRKTKTGYSTDIDVLEKLRFYHPVVDLILEFRKYMKSRNTYILPFIEFASDNGRIHTTFNLTGTTTGRFSSINPNMQNLPVTTEDELNIKKAFIVSKQENIFVSADYSQIELRIIAHLSGDEYMIDAFNNGIDIHTATALKIFELDNRDSVTSEMRRTAKTINFGLLYGMGAHALAEDLKIPHYQAKNFIDNYFKQFGRVKNFFDNIIEEASKTGFVSSMLGRRRYIPELKSANKNIQQAGIRMAMNMPIQGTAADILKLAMIDIHSYLNKYRAECLLTIHDELVFELPETNCEEFKNFLKNAMENIIKLKAPLKVNLGSGKNLSELK